MTAVDRIVATLLRLAARRWPADLRTEVAAEWWAEVAAVRTDPTVGPVRSAARALRFALSLLGSPPVEDEHGVPRGWRETLPGAGGVARAVALVVAATVAACFLAAICTALIAASFGGPGRAPAAVAGWLALPAGLVAGWLVGRFAPPRGPDGTRLGPGGTIMVALTAGTLTHVGWALRSRSSDLITEPLPVVVGIVAALLVWAPVMAGTMRSVDRRVTAGRGPAAIARAATGIAAALFVGTVAVALPPTLAAGDSVGSALVRAPRVLLGLDAFADVPGSADVHNTMTTAPLLLMALSAVAVGFGYGTRRSVPHRARRPDVLPDGAGVPLPAPLRAAALLLVLVAVGGWAWTLGVLTPDMAQVAQRGAPVPGGDSELYMWTDELRWATIALAVLALLAGAAAAPAAPLGAALVTVALLGVDAAVYRTHRPTDPRPLLAVGLMVVLIGWLVAGGGRSRVDPAVARRRLTVAAVTAAVGGPLLTLQGTSAENHPYLLPSVGRTQAAAMAGYAALAVVAALAARPRPVPVPVAVPALVLPVAVFGGLGAATGLGLEITSWGLLLSGPMLLLVLGLALPRPHRAGLWWGVGGALAVPASVLVTVVGIAVSALVGGVLWSLTGTGGYADGLPALPGGVLAALLVATLGTWLGGPPAVAGPPPHRAAPPLPGR